MNWMVLTLIRHRSWFESFAIFQIRKNYQNRLYLWSFIKKISSLDQLIHQTRSAGTHKWNWRKCPCTTVFIRWDKVDLEQSSKNTCNLFFSYKEWWLFWYYLVIIKLILTQLEGLLVWIRKFQRYHSATGCRLRLEKS